MSTAFPDAVWNSYAGISMIKIIEYYPEIHSYGATLSLILHVTVEFRANAPLPNHPHRACMPTHALYENDCSGIYPCCQAGNVRHRDEEIAYAKGGTRTPGTPPTRPRAAPVGAALWICTSKSNFSLSFVAATIVDKARRCSPPASESVSSRLPVTLRSARWYRWLHHRSATDQAHRFDRAITR